MDDPPVSGTALATAARAVVRGGVPHSRIVFLLSLFGSSEQPPEVLRDWSAVVQPWADWSVHRRLAAQPVRQALASLVDPDLRSARHDRLERRALPVNAGTCALGSQSGSSIAALVRRYIGRSWLRARA